MEYDAKTKLKQIIDVLDQLSEDTSVPRNIRRGATEAKGRLNQDGEALDVRVAGAIGKLDDLANDPNIPMHGRTVIYRIISELENLLKAVSK
ncbi:hypothetical protein DSECCO2_344390 [anaerobic digester metagenome]|jgi:uncharacterized protein (UPF0147 family)|nr:UPF0147 family protein [Methanomassiliicoccales archaeon]HQN75703.1 UPF0147 family protein [Methanomassiliicoccales archaeon]